MCGIAGLADFTGRPADGDLLDRMCAAIRHRGPDDQGIVCFPLGAPTAGVRPTAALGSRRLSIVDVAGGHQPIANEDRTVWVVLNGEIYNYAALRAELDRRGHRFTTDSDTEVIVHLYEDRGDACIEALDGMFAFALWDDRGHRLLLGRDRFGKKPLLYADTPGRLAFASEFQALLQDPALPRDFDLGAVDSYLSFMSIPAPATIYRSVRKVPPAHLLIRDRDGVRLRRYWSLPYRPKLQIGEPEAAERLRELLTAAVRKRLMGEVPLGAFLSGGVDSSAVVALMAGLSNRPVKTFSIGFDEARYNELPHARRIAERFGSEHHEFVVRPRATEVLPTLVRHFGEPYADSSAIPSFYLSRLTREHVTVALNGDGGDEAFAGYTRHLGNRLAERWQAAPALIQSAGALLARRVAVTGPDARGWSVRLGRFARVAASPRADRYRAWVGVMSDDLKASLVGTLLPGVDGTLDGLFAGVEDLDAVDAMLSVDTAFYLPTDLLVKVDITSMANSLEARSPFLDTELVEFAAQLPSHLKVRRLTSKHILKRALKGIVPPENLYRPKVGFAVPIAQWFRGELRELLRDHLLSSPITQCGLFRPEGIERLVDAHVAGRADHAHPLWVLLMFDLWHREFVSPAHQTQ